MFNRIDAVLDAAFGGRIFEVYSVASGESLSASMSFSAASDEMESIGYGSGHSGAPNGIDIREVKS